MRKLSLNKRRLETAVVAAVALLGLMFTHLYVIFYTPASRDATPVLVNVTRGASFRVVASSLHDSGLIRDTDEFLFAARLMGAYKKTKAGEYEFKPSMSPVEIIGMLVEGKVKDYQVTIPEGYGIKEIASALEARNLSEREEFISLATDPGFASELGFEGASLEGYLFPDTYFFAKGTTVRDIIRRMTDRFRSVYDREFSRLAKRRGFTMKEVVTFASIIEKEAAAPEERPLISAVFHNRLRKGIKLQSDPTVIYTIGDFDGKITKEHLRTRNPYNTYLNYGLPPGPIANPGKDSIRAALEPADEDYLFFVSRNDGTHYFSKSLKEHTNAVNRFQRQPDSDPGF